MSIFNHIIIVAVIAVIAIILQMLWDTAKVEQARQDEITDNGKYRAQPGRQKRTSATEQAQRQKAREGFFAKSDLLRRGWSAGDIKRFLGKPDTRAPNPYIDGGTAMYLYNAQRVKKVETAMHASYRN